MICPQCSEDEMCLYAYDILGIRFLPMLIMQECPCGYKGFSELSLIEFFSKDFMFFLFISRRFPFIHIWNINIAVDNPKLKNLLETSVKL